MPEAEFSDSRIEWPKVPQLLLSTNVKYVSKCKGGGGGAGGRDVAGRGPSEKMDEWFLCRFLGF